jgi:hypothetical protein
VLAGAKSLEVEDIALHTSEDERSQQLQEEADLINAVAAAQERIHAAASTLDEERAQAVGVLDRQPTKGITRSR